MIQFEDKLKQKNKNLKNRETNLNKSKQKNTQLRMMCTKNLMGFKTQKLKWMKYKKPVTLK